MSKQIGKRLQQLFSNKTNIEIGELLEVSDSAVSKYFRGRIPSGNKLLQIFELTNCNLHWLLTGEGEKYQHKSPLKPTTIMFQGCKGGVGNSTVASLVALILARQNQNVLLVDNGVGDSAFMSVVKEKAKFNSLKSDRIMVLENSLVESWIPGLDVFLPKKSNWDSSLNSYLTPFEVDSTEITQKYDYLIIDAHSSVNLFSNEIMTDPSTQIIRDSFKFNIRNAKVFVPYQPFNSKISNIKSVIRNIKSGIESNNDTAELTGIFINGLDTRYKSDLEFYNEQLDEVREFAKDKLLDSVIHMNIKEKRSIDNASSDIFEEEFEIISEYKTLVDEILNRLGVKN